MIKISASIMCGNPLNLGDEIKRLEKANIDMLHCDITDGVFVPDITMGLHLLETIKENTFIPLDVHLMVVDPDKYLEGLAKIGADVVSVHAEASNHLHRTVQEIRSLGMKAGVVVCPATPVITLKHVLADVEMVVIMTVNPGFAGQKFIYGTVEKIQEIKEMVDQKNLNVMIEVDGNINNNTIPMTVTAGANVLVLGSSSIFKGDDCDYRIEVEGIRELAEEYSATKKFKIS